MSVKWWADEDVEAAHPWAWPLILDAIKAGGGVASDRALWDGRMIRAAGLTGIIADNGRSILDAFICVGLVVEVDGGYTARSWSEYQREDEAKKERQRRWRDKKRAGDVAAALGDASETSQRRRGDVAATATVHDSTVHDGDETRVTAPPSPPAPTVAEATRDDVQTKIQGHPAHDALLPIARVAFQVLGVCPEVYTLEAWLQSGYSISRIEYGLRQAKQAAAGQWMPMGKVIISAGRWMQRADPQEYEKRPQQAAGGARASQAASAPQLPSKPSITPEEAAEMLRELGV